MEEVWRDLLGQYEATGVFRGMIALYGPDSDLAVTLTLWTSDDDATAVSGALRALAGAAFADVLTEAPRIEKFDVLLAKTV